MESYSEFVERALYAPGTGFYEVGGRAGRRGGHFLTSPEVGPLFGAVLARAIDAWWEEQGRPDPFLVDEHGAGPGTLARAVVAARPACAAALRWTLVERSAAQRALHDDHLPRMAPADPRWTAPGGGPWTATSADPSPGPVHLAVANELLDNLPFDLWERTADGWAEVRVAGADGGSGGRGPRDGVGSEGGTLHEVLGPVRPRPPGLPAPAVDGVPVGHRVPVQARAAAWLTDVLARLAGGGRVLVVDYASTTAALGRRPWTEWVRTYVAHGRGGPALGAPGTQDITVEVCVDQLVAAAGPPVADRDQSAFLRSWGLEALVEEGRAVRARGVGRPDLAALRLASRVAEAEALCDPSGLGAFRALEWRRPPGS